jgi:DNA-binding SARP family transcriptional activator
MKLVPSNTELLSSPLDDTIQGAAIKQLEAVRFGIIELRDAQIALAAGNLERTSSLLQLGLNYLGETAIHAILLMAELARHQDQPKHGSPSVPAIHDAQRLDLQPPNRHLLKLQTLGALEVQLNANPVRFPFAKCAELLVWLVLHGPATRDQICDALWDGSVTHGNLEYFRVVVRRTRAALIHAGSLKFNPVIFERKLYGLSPQLEVCMDALELATAVKTSSPERLRMVGGVYQGEFMPYTTSEWANLERTKIVDLALEATLQLAELLEENEPRLAVEAYQRAIEIEPLSEIAQARLIHLHRQLGESSAAEAVNRAYQKAIVSEV